MDMFSVDQEQLNRLGLRDGQFFAVFNLKNLHWILDGKRIGFGDLRQIDIEMIRDLLEPGEVFLGFNEHHGSRWQQIDQPMICIKKDMVSYPYLEAQLSRANKSVV